MPPKMHRYKDMLAAHVKKGDMYMGKEGETRHVWTAEANARQNGPVVYILIRWASDGKIVERQWGWNQPIPGIIRRPVNRR